MSLYRLRFLGDFSLIYDGRPVTSVTSARMQSLLAYLVLHRDAHQSRQYLAFIFWPDSSEAQAHTNLRNLFYKLRRALPDADRFIQADTRTLFWRPDTPFTLDVARFEDAISGANTMTALREAVDLYKGDLLPSIYDEWVQYDRDRLRQRFIQTLAQLIHMLEEQREYQATIRYGKRLLRHDPLHESTYRCLMRLHASSGDRASALRVYHACANALQRELDVEPSPETREAYERILRGETQPVSSAGFETVKLTASPLVGRDKEWAELKSAWRTTARRGARLALVSGEAGIGKTRLIEELFDWARRQGIAALGTRSYEAEGSLAYAPVTAWLRADILQEAASSLEYIWLTEVARLIPELLVERLDLPAPGPLTESWQRQRMFEAMTRYILAGKQPLLLHIDDLQWCDQETLEWLHFLIRFDRRAQLLVVGTVRPEEIGPDHALNSLLLALRHSRQLFEIDLKPLNSTETATLATHVAGRDLGSDLLAKMYQETEGNPLFVVEMVRSGLPSGDTDDVNKSPFLPPTVQTVITSRLAQLSSEARELVELAAVIGRAFDFNVLAQASEIDEETLVRRLDELWQRRIVREQGAEAYDFSHDKIREAAYASMSQARRRLQHRRVARALEFIHASHLEAVSGRIAVHYEQAGQWERAIPFYQRAVQAAQHVYANEEAIQYLKRALAPFDRALPADKEGEWHVVIAELHEHLGDILHLTGRHNAARRAYQDALSHAPEGDRLWLSGLHQKEGNTWRSESRYEDALRAYQSAETVLGKATVALTTEWWQEWLQIQLERIWVHYWLNQWTKIAELIEAVRLVVERYATPNQHINFLVSSGSVNMRKNRYVIQAETISLCQAALTISQELDDAGETAWIRFVLGFGRLWRGELKRAEKQMYLALETAERTGDVVHQSRCLTYLTVLYRKQEQVAKVQRYLSLSLQAARTAMMPEYIGTAEANLSWVAWREGDLEAAKKHGRSALASWQKLPIGHASCAFQWTALWPLIGVALTRDEDAEAVSYAQALLESSQQRLPDALAAEVEEAVHTWDPMKPETTRTHLERAITLAQRMGYL